MKDVALPVTVFGYIFMVIIVLMEYIHIIFLSAKLLLLHSTY